MEESGTGMGAVEARWGEEALFGSYEAINEYFYLSTSISISISIFTHGSIHVCIHTYA